MKKFILKAGLFLLPIMAIPIINFISDPAGLFHGIGHTQKMAKAILAGQKPYFTSGNGDERMVKHHLIINMPGEVDCIAVGTSLVMLIQQNMTSSNLFYNLGESGADIYDILAQFGTMRSHNKKINRVIFGMDLYSFDEAQYKNHTRNIPLKPFAHYMINLLNGEKLNRSKINYSANLQTSLSNLFSARYFTDSVKYLKSKEKVRTEFWGIADENFPGAYYMPDASWVYSQEYRNSTTPEYVKKNSNEYPIDRMFTPNEHISEFSKDIFEKLLNYLFAQDVEVELFMCPLAPSLWNRIDLKKHFILQELYDYVNFIASKYDLKITGNYNPYELGMTDADFYDARHVRAECFQKYFDFTKKQ